MINVLRDNKKYKIIYSIIVLLISAFTSCLAGYDYRFSLINSSESIYASYGELLVVMILAISGSLVLICRNIRINAAYCVILIVLQLGSFCFCEKYELSESIAIIKWFSLLIVPFTLMLIEPKTNNKEKLHMKMFILIKSIVLSILGTILSFSGITSFFQSGVLHAEIEMLGGEKIDICFFCIGLIMLVNGILFVYFSDNNTNKYVPYFMISTLLISSVSLLIQGVEGIPALIFYVIVMFISAASEFITTIIFKDN